MFRYCFPVLILYFCCGRVVCPHSVVRVSSSVIFSSEFTARSLARAGAGAHAGSCSSRLGLGRDSRFQGSPFSLSPHPTLLLHPPSPHPHPLRWRDQIDTQECRALWAALPLRLGVPEGPLPSQETRARLGEARKENVIGAWSATVWPG